MSGITFNATYPCDKEAQSKMAKISEKQRKAKEKVIFDNAMASIKLDHWKDASFDSFSLAGKMI